MYIIVCVCVCLYLCLPVMKTRACLQRSTRWQNVWTRRRRLSTAQLWPAVLKKGQTRQQNAASHQQPCQTCPLGKAFQSSTFLGGQMLTIGHFHFCVSLHRFEAWNTLSHSKRCKPFIFITAWELLCFTTAYWKEPFWIFSLFWELFCENIWSRSKRKDVDVQFQSSCPCKSCGLLSRPPEQNHRGSECEPKGSC